MRGPGSTEEDINLAKQLNNEPNRDKKERDNTVDSKELDM